MIELTREQLRGLADMNRRMDSGELPHVLLNGDPTNRIPLPPEQMEEFGFTQGQTITRHMFQAVAGANILRLEALILAKEIEEDPLADELTP